MQFQMRNDQLPANLVPHLAKKKFKLGADEVAELKRLKPLDDAFDKRIAPIDESCAQLQAKHAAAQERARTGTASPADLELVATFDVEELKRRFAKTKRQIEDEREEFYRGEVHPVLNRCADTVCAVANAARDEFERKLRDLYADAGVPFHADHPVLHSIDRWRDTSSAALRPHREFPAGPTQIRAVLGECSPI